NTINTSARLDNLPLPVAIKVGAGFLGGIDNLNTSTGSGINGVLLVADQISSNVTWPSNTSLPYILCGRSTVAAGVTLSVEKGTVVKAVHVGLDTSLAAGAGLGCATRLAKSALIVNGT